MLYLDAGAAIIAKCGEVIQIGLDGLPPCLCLSTDARVLSVLQNGKVFFNAPGSARVLAVSDGIMKADIPFTVRPGDLNHPKLFNRYNRISCPDGEIGLIDGKLCQGEKKIYADCRLHEALSDMCNAALLDDVYLLVNHGYRDQIHQAIVARKIIRLYGVEAAKKRCAPVGFSEHHSGLALDMTGGIVQGESMRRRAPKIAWRWLDNHCHEYGFIIKNPEGKTCITGTQYEPWHIRYIEDLDVAALINDLRITLDEYLDRFLPVDRRIDVARLARIMPNDSPRRYCMKAICGSLSPYLSVDQFDDSDA